MLFTSLPFLLFAALTLLCYFLFPKRWQWGVLLVASLAFYLLSDPSAVVFLLYTAAVTYLGARLLQRRIDREDAYVENNRDTLSKAERKAYRAAEKKKRFRLLILFLILGFGVMAVLKYTAFVLSGVREVWTLFGGESFSLPNLLLPLGLSFYTFQSMGYLIDVYRKQAKAEENPAKFLLFVSFFPQLLQGPISRFASLAEQLTAPHSFDGLSFRSGLLRVLWGYFKKLVMADTALVAVKALIEPNSSYTGGYVFLLILFYSVQIYGDFTGGIDITLGLSEMMGIRVAENFNRPFSSKSTKEYWNRWHITMGSWFTDYIFYPLSVSRPLQALSAKTSSRLGDGLGMRLPVYIATIATWFLTGLWHGAGMNFIVWGLLNCLVILVSRECEPLYRRFRRTFPRLTASYPYGCFCAVRTFLLMGLIRSLDCYRDVGRTFSLWWSMLADFNWGEIFTGGLFSLGLGLSDYCVILAGAALAFAVSKLGEKSPLRHRIGRGALPFTAAACLLTVLILLFGAYGIGYDASQFIYTQF